MATKNPPPTFRVGDVFPADDASTALVRFLVSTRLLMVIGRIPGYRQGQESPAIEEEGAFLMLASMGAAKEAADAFRYADGYRCFQVIEDHGTADQKERLERLRRECDKDDPQSLYCRTVKHARDKAGSHWNRDLVKEALEAFEDDEIPMWEGGDTFADRAVPLTRGVALHMARINHPPKQERLANASDVAQLQGDLFHVADTAYVLILEKKYG